MSGVPPEKTVSTNNVGSNKSGNDQEKRTISRAIPFRKKKKHNNDDNDTDKNKNKTAHICARFRAPSQDERGLREDLRCGSDGAGVNLIETKRVLQLVIDRLNETRSTRYQS